jgi:hypothetical protein
MTTKGLGAKVRVRVKIRVRFRVNVRVEVKDGQRSTLLSNQSLL